MLTRALRRLLPEQPQPPKINFTRNRRRRTAHPEYRHVIPHFLFVRTKNDWNLYRKLFFVCDANPRLAARWHDAAYCSPQDCAGRGLPQRRPAIVRECSRRGPRRLLPENVEFHSSISRLGNSSKLDCTRLNEMVPINDACGSLSRAVRRRPTAADCCRIPTAVGERHIPTNCAASRHYLRQSAQNSPPAAAHFSTKKDRPNPSGSLFSKNLNYKLAIL